MKQPWSIGIVIPARNEVDSIAQCVRSVFAAAEGMADLHALCVVVVADTCSDDTAAVARRELGQHGTVICATLGSVGAARALGVKTVLERFSGTDLRTIWLAHTDADTAVPPNWLSVQLAYAREGHAAVAGIVKLDDAGSAEAQELYAATYVIRADGTHPHVHGANIGLRGDAYVDIGGWSDLALAEDHCLWRRLRARGWRACSPADSVVFTSARLQGRAAGGFAESLRREIAARICRLRGALP